MKIPLYYTGRLRINAPRQSKSKKISAEKTLGFLSHLGESLEKPLFHLPYFTLIRPKNKKSSLFLYVELNNYFNNYLYSIYMLPLALPLAHIGLMGSIYSTLAITIERYIAVCHPFLPHTWVTLLRTLLSKYLVGAFGNILIAYTKIE